MKLKDGVVERLSFLNEFRADPHGACPPTSAAVKHVLAKVSGVHWKIVTRPEQGRAARKIDR